MKEVKSPKKPLLYYYVIITAVIILFNLILTPTLMKKQITDVHYGTFMAMINDKNIGKVAIDDSKILFTNKEFCKSHPIFFIFFNSYTNKYKHKIKSSFNDLYPNPPFEPIALFSQLLTACTSDG